MAAGYVELQVGGNPGGPIGDGPGAVGFGADKIDRDGEAEVPGQVGEEEKSTGGDADEDEGLGERGVVGGDLGGELGDSGGDLVRGPQNTLYMRVQGHFLGFFFFLFFFSVSSLHFRLFQILGV